MPKQFINVVTPCHYHQLVELMQHYSSCFSTLEIHARHYIKLLISKIKLRLLFHRFAQQKANRVKLGTPVNNFLLN